MRSSDNKHLSLKGLSLASELNNHRLWLMAYLQGLSQDPQQQGIDPGELEARKTRIKVLEYKLGWNLPTSTSSIQHVPFDLYGDEDFIITEEAEVEEVEDDTEGGKYTLLDSTDPKIQQYWRNSKAVQIKTHVGIWKERVSNFLNINLSAINKFRVRTDYSDKEGKPKRGGLLGVLARVQNSISDTATFMITEILEYDDSRGYPYGTINFDQLGKSYWKHAFYIDPADVARIRGHDDADANFN